jgi:hypothetical protein
MRADQFPEDVMALKVQVVFDCASPDRLAKFWAAALGYQLQPPPEGFSSWEEFAIAHKVPRDQWDARSAVVDPGGSGPRIFFQRVPEPKVVKNRVHLDINASDHNSARPERRRKVDEEAERLLSLGATRLRAMEQLGEYWIVMADPEGNEFCVQ